jgi:hypothetical protein
MAGFPMQQVAVMISDGHALEDSSRCLYLCGAPRELRRS